MPNICLNIIFPFAPCYDILFHCGAEGAISEREQISGIKNTLFFRKYILLSSRTY